MRVVVPREASRLEVGHCEDPTQGEGTFEDKLLQFGKTALKLPLTPMYCEFSDGTPTYITDPLGNREQGTEGFLRSQGTNVGWIADLEPGMGEESWIIHDLEKPSIQVTSLDKVL